jgi:hypothetical protein
MITDNELRFQIFESIDSLNSLLRLFELLNMALECVDSDEESDARISLLITSFLLRAEPSLEEILSNLKSVYLDLRSSQAAQSKNSRP